MDVKPAGPGQPIRILRGIGVPAGNYDLYIVLHERPARGDGPGGGACLDRGPGRVTARRLSLKQPLDVPNYAVGEFATSTVILAERVDQLPSPITPDQQSEHPTRSGRRRSSWRPTGNSRSRRS